MIKIISKEKYYELIDDLADAKREIEKLNVDLNDLKNNDCFDKRIENKFEKIANGDYKDTLDLLGKEWEADMWRAGVDLKASRVIEKIINDVKILIVKLSEKKEKGKK